jgi:hypothetical protein
MIFSQLLTSFGVAGLAASVTVGSMYVTVNAAVQQEAVSEPVVEQVPEVPVVDVLTPDQIRHNFDSRVVLDNQGGFNGQLVGLTAMDEMPAAGCVVKVLQMGVTTARVVTDDLGRFRVTGLKPGVAGIVAFSKSGVLVVGARLVEATPDNAPADVQLAVDSAMITGVDSQLALRLIFQSLAPRGVRFVEETVAEDNLFPFGVGERAPSLSHSPVQLQADGTLLGEIAILDERTGRNREVLDLTVRLIRDGEIVATTEVEKDGSFVISGVAPGLYGVVATGQDGTFAIGMEAIEAGAAIAPGDAQPVAVFRASGTGGAGVGSGNLNQGNVDSVFEGDISDGNNLAAVPPVTPPGAMGAGGGGFGGGTGGGGAGGGGIGGLGALLGAAAGGALGYLAGDDDDPPASPGN